MLITGQNIMYAGHVTALMVHFPSKYRRETLCNVEQLPALFLAYTGNWFSSNVCLNTNSSLCKLHISLLGEEYWHLSAKHFRINLSLTISLVCLPASFSAFPYASRHFIGVTCRVYHILIDSITADLFVAEFGLLISSLCTFLPLWHKQLHSL
jgi:hypothetical protein